MAQTIIGKDFRNQSFRGQKDLAGVDFTDADLRGCDFRDALLIGANFTGVKTGKSCKQLITLIAFAFLGTTAVVVAGVSVGVVAEAGVFAFAVAGAIAFAFAFVFAGAGVVAGMFTFSFVLVFAVAAIGHAYTTFLARKIALGIVNSVVSLLLLFFAWYCLQQLVKTIKSATGTDFRGADLSGAKFVKAHLEVTDFTNAKCDLINWQGAEFYLCKLPKNIENDKVGYLCINPAKRRDADYTSSDFRNTYLQNVDLIDAILRNANFNGADLRGAKLINADLSNSQALGTDFSGATLTGARIFNWGINPETKFENVICTHIYIDEVGKERKPASGEFKEGDFAILVTKFTKTLDFLFKNGIQPQAFDQALQEMLDRYGEFGIQLQSVESVGDGDRLVRFEVQDPDADKGEIHADFENKYYGVIRQLEEAQNKVQELQQAQTELSTKLAISEAVIKEKENQSLFLRDFVYHQTDRFSRPSFNASHSTFTGDPMSDKNQNISLNAGRDITVAGGDIDISGTITVTIQQLRNSVIPEAPEIADLLTELQKLISESPDLSDKDRQKILTNIDNIGKIANNKEGDRNSIENLIDGIVGAVSKFAKLLTPIQAIADGLRKLLQL
jgi:uncharacterized protein YjbI with pentapeptide repeats